MRFCSVTLGCKVNQYETQAMENILSSRGHTLVKAGDGCDVCIVNTCAVTSESSRKSRQAARRVRKLEPGALIAVCGCLTELEYGAPERFGADIIGGSGNRQAFALEIERMYLQHLRRLHGDVLAADAVVASSTAYLADADITADTEDAADADTVDAAGTVVSASRRYFEQLPPGSAAGRTRALLKIQDGCDNFCAYCVIPYVRGRVRSLPPQKAAEYARRLEGQGFREIVVTGIEISSYGKDLQDGVSLPDAAAMIGEAAPNARIRLGSLDPGTVDAAFCGAMASIPNICGHFHLSLQSGCDDTLLRMGRKYDTAAAQEAVALLRARFPDCGITADLITGFPGETDAEFARTMEFITAAEFSDMHIFPFSPRPGTRAAVMPDQVEKEVRRERARIASRAAEDMAGAFKRSLTGKKLRVLFERELNGAVLGHSDNYVEVAVRTPAWGGGALFDSGAGSSMRNTIHTVQISSVEDGVVWAEIV